MGHTRTKLGDGKEKPAGTWDWYGSLDPAHKPANHLSGYHTFSIGVFQWQPKWNWGTKRGKSVKRFTAPMHAPEEAYTKARAFIAQQTA